MVEKKMLVDKMDVLADEDQNITITRVIGSFVLPRQVPILCQWSADLTLNKQCLPCSN